MSFEHNSLLKIAVIGAGVSGLSVASLLGAAGQKVHVFEKSEKIREIIEDTRKLKHETIKKIIK